MICVLCLFVKFIVTKHSGVFIFPFFPLNSLRYLSYYNSNEKTLYREHCLPVCVQAQYLLLKRFFFSNTHCSCSNCLLVCTPRKQFWETIIPQHQWFSVCRALYTLHKQTTETYSLETSSVTVPVVALSLQRFRFKVPPCISRPTETLKNKNLKNIVYLFIFFTFS